MSPVVTPAPIATVIGICGVGTLVLGVFPAIVMRFADYDDLVRVVAQVSP